MKQTTANKQTEQQTIKIKNARMNERNMFSLILRLQFFFLLVFAS